MWVCVCQYFEGGAFLNFLETAFSPSVHHFKSTSQQKPKVDGKEFCCYRLFEWIQSQVINANPYFWTEFERTIAKCCLWLNVQQGKQDFFVLNRQNMIFWQTLFFPSHTHFYTRTHNTHLSTHKHTHTQTLTRTLIYNNTHILSRKYKLKHQHILTRTHIDTHTQKHTQHTQFWDWTTWVN